MEQALLKAKKIYDNGKPINEWIENNLPKEYGRNSVLNQVERIKAVELLGYPVGMDYEPKIVGQHKSKSIPLPVFCLKYGILSSKNERENPNDTDIEFYVFVRDNFYDVKLVVVSDCEMDLPYDLIHSHLTEKEYEEEKQSAIGRKDENNEMVKMIRANDDNWIKRWSGRSASILRKDGQIYKTSGYIAKVYCEGIENLNLPDHVFEPYQNGKKQFTICKSWVDIPLILQHLKSEMSEECAFRRYGKRYREKSWS